MKFEMNNQLSKKSERTAFNGIDLFKFIGVFLICSIHISIFPDTDSAIINYLNSVFGNCIARVAVPFYFSVTGFLLFRDKSISTPDPNRVKKYCFKILRLLGTWTLLLFVGYKGLSRRAAIYGCRRGQKGRPEDEGEAISACR